MYLKHKIWISKHIFHEQYSKTNIAVCSIRISQVILIM